MKKWKDCPLGITAREKKDPPRMRVQEVASGEKDLRVFVIDSEERRHYEEAMRTRSMEKTREKLAAVQKRVAQGDLVEAAKIGEVERGFRHLKDVLALRPIYHRIAPRVRGDIFVAALALLVERLLERRLKEAGVALFAPEALQSLATIRLVTFRLPGQPPCRDVSSGSPRARQVLEALGISDLKPPTPPAPGSGHSSGHSRDTRRLRVTAQHTRLPIHPLSGRVAGTKMRGKAQYHITYAVSTSSYSQTRNGRIK